MEKFKLKIIICSKIFTKLFLSALLLREANLAIALAGSRGGGGEGGLEVANGSPVGSPFKH